MNRPFVVLALLFPALAAIAESYSPQVIKIYDEEELNRLEEDGAVILRRRGDILLCLIPTDADNEIVIPNSCRKVKVKNTRQYPAGDNGRGMPGEFNRFNVPALDVGVSHFDAADIMYGAGFDSPYTGKGVVVGICDIGFDPLHPTFLDENGESRVKRVTQYREREGLRVVMENDRQYAEWITDNPDEYHATHVCGILAGNGAGSPYVGIAREADIVVSTSTLSDVGLLAGVEDIIDYAREVGKPAVVNLSMGNYTGPHDGSSLFSQYLDLCSDDAIIVLSSGNEGNKTNSLLYDFTSGKNEIGFCLGNRRWDQLEMYGVTDIWGSDDSPLVLEISIFDDETHEMVYTYPLFSLEDYDIERIEWNPEEPLVSGCALDGYMLLTMGIDPENGRRQAKLMYDYVSSVRVSDKSWARYVVAVKVKGHPGQSVDVFSDGTYTRLMQMSGNPAPGTSMSISDLACGRRVVSCGMYGNADESTVVHSSYGTLRDGRVLPLTVAPGYSLVSSLSRPYLDAHPDRQHISLSAPWVEEGGTSMASPYVAGFIATWLEAFPTLSAEDIQKVIAESNRRDIPDLDNPRNANGWFDPKSAFMTLLHEAGVEEIENEFNFGQEEMVEVFTIDGRLVREGKAVGCGSLPKGVYIIKSDKSGRSMKVRI